MSGLREEPVHISGGRAPGLSGQKRAVFLSFERGSSLSAVRATCFVYILSFSRVFFEGRHFSFFFPHRPPRNGRAVASPTRPLHIPPRLATHSPPHLTVTSTGNVHLVTAGLSANGAAASQRGARGHTPGSTLHVSTAPHLPPRQRASVLASQRLSISRYLSRLSRIPTDRAGHAASSLLPRPATAPNPLIVQAALGSTEL